MKPYYSEAGITIYHGSCEDVFPELLDVDVMITDPPYSEHTHKKQWIGSALTKGKARNGTKFKGLGFDPITPELMHLTVLNAKAIVRRWSMFFTDLEGIALWREIVLDLELEYVRTMIWDKVDSAPQFTGDRPAAGAEAIVLAHKAGKKRWNGGGRRNVFTYPVNGCNQGSKPHPSTKPEALMRELVALFTDEGETILDPFMGSGSTLVAAKRLCRKAIGVEIDKSYCDVAIERLRQGALFASAS
jgi:site-specific DNA-methyltransferase (adenine-specific)